MPTKTGRRGFLPGSAVSDADPSAIPGAKSPFAYQTVVGTSPTQLPSTQTDFLISVDQLFRETGPLSGRRRPSGWNRRCTRLACCTPMIPNRSGSTREGQDISGVTLFSPKRTRVLAGRDLAGRGVLPAKP